MEPNYNPFENSPLNDSQNENQNSDNKEHAYKDSQGNPENVNKDTQDNYTFNNNSYNNNNYNDNFNPYTSGNYGYHTPQFQPARTHRSNFFEAASMVLGIGAIVSCTCFYGAYVMGAMAILFALLSRGGQMKMSAKARTGLILGIAAILLTTVVTIGAFYIALEEFGSLENILRTYCDMYGLDFEQEFGILFE